MLPEMNGPQRILAERGVGDIAPDGDQTIFKMDETGLLPDGLLGDSGNDKKKPQSDKKKGFRYLSMYSSGFQYLRLSFLGSESGRFQDIITSGSTKYFIFPYLPE
jgi:hypothetical protein